MDRVHFPEDEDHIILNDYPETLDRLLQALKGRRDIASKQLAAVLGNMRKWAGPKQRQGVLNKNDLLQMGDEEWLNWVLKLIESFRG